MAGFKKEFFFSPIGTVEPFCAIQKPDYGNPEKGFGNPRGIYKIDLTVSRKAAEPLMAKIIKAHETNYAKLVAEFEKNPPQAARGKKVLQPYEGDMPFFENDDGTVTFKFKGYASYLKDGESVPIVLRVVDSKGRPMRDVPNISGGSEGKVRFSLFPYGWSNVAGASVKLQLDSFMLTKLVEFAAGGSDWAGQEEQGFEDNEEREAEQWREEPSYDDVDQGDDSAGHEDF